jgi:undecaprenyl-diphosphatase
MLRQPVGVCATICPFNFPGMIAFWYLPYALACGNTYIIKPSEKVPMTMQVIFQLIHELGLPKGVINLVNGGKEAVDALLDHPAIRAITFVGATLSISGAVPERVATTPTFLTQVATSFSNKLAPSTVGGMTLNIRFVQHQGVDRGAATASVGLNAMGGWVVHTVLLVLFALAAGRSAFGDVKLPNPEALLIGAGVVCVLAVAVLAIPSVRSMMADKALPTLRRSVTGLRSVLHRPAKVIELLGGNLVVVLSLLACFVCSIAAFGGGLRLVTLGAVYLVGSSVAMIAPTPSGLGAVEAALVAGLVAAGMEGSVAVPAVFLFRVATFWLPIVPGWLCLLWLRRHGNV